MYKTLLYIYYNSFYVNHFVNYLEGLSIKISVFILKLLYVQNNWLPCSTLLNTFVDWHQEGKLGNHYLFLSLQYWIIIYWRVFTITGDTDAFHKMIMQKKVWECFKHRLPASSMGSLSINEKFDTQGFGVCIFF